MARDPWQVLGLEPGATEQDIRSAYRRIAFESHPDRNPDDPDAAKRFREASEAWQVLKDPARRAAVGRGGRGPDDGWVDLVELIARHELDRLVNEVLPVYVALHPLQPRTRVLLLWDDLQRGTERSGPVAGWARSMARLVGHLDLVVTPGGGFEPVRLARRPRWAVLVDPVALHRQGLEDEDDLRVVLTTWIRLSAVGAWALRSGMILRQVDEAARERAVGEDRQELIQRVIWGGIWAVVLGLSGVMIWAAAPGK